MPKIGFRFFPAIATTFRIVPSPPRTTIRSERCAICTIEPPAFCFAILAVSFSTITSNDRSLNSPMTSRASFATPAFSVCAIKPIVFVRIEKIPGYHLRQRRLTAQGQ